ncbi:MAG: chemotaxis protein CheW [Sulfuricella sp.]|nr:chemotaxis protein CheW [Sulfuricella sp.]
MGAVVQANSQVAAVEENQGQFLTFLLGGEMFAIPILNIKEIIEYGSLTSVPMMPAFIRGVINLRGRVVPVVDIAQRFGRNPTAVTRRTCIVIVEIVADGERLDVGMVVDSVSEVLEIPHGEIEPPPSFGARIRADFIYGMGKISGKFVVILNVDKVLSIEEMALLGQAGNAAPDALPASAAG